MGLESIDKVDAKIKMQCIFYAHPFSIEACEQLNSSALCFTPFPLSILPVKYKYVCDIIATIMEYDSTEGGMSLHCHGNRQTVFITGSFRLSLKH